MGLLPNPGPRDDIESPRSSEAYAPGVPAGSRPDIERLIQRVAEGDLRAFADLYDETVPRVFGLLRHILGSDELAETVAQEVYRQVWLTAHAYDPRRASVATWITLLARSRALDRVRADRSYTDLESLNGQPPAAPPGNQAPGPEHPASLNDRGEVRAALSGLPDEQRQALEMAFFSGLTHREIAEHTRTPLGTVRSRVRTAMSRLRDMHRPPGPATETHPERALVP